MVKFLVRPTNGQSIEALLADLRTVDAEVTIKSVQRHEWLVELPGWGDPDLLGHIRTRIEEQGFVIQEEEVPPINPLREVRQEAQAALYELLHNRKFNPQQEGCFAVKKGCLRVLVDAVPMGSFYYCQIICVVTIKDEEKSMPFMQHAMQAVTGWRHGPLNGTSILFSGSGDNDQSSRIDERGFAWMYIPAEGGTFGIYPERN